MNLKITVKESKQQQNNELNDPIYIKFQNIQKENKGGQEGGLTKRYEETFEDDGYVCYLD